MAAWVMGFSQRFGCAHKRRRLAVLLLTLMVAGCGGGGGGGGQPAGGPPAPPHGTYGQVVTAVTWPLSQDTFQLLTQSDIASLNAKGFSFSGTTLNFPVTPMTGKWVTVGAQAVMTDRRGNFQVPVTPSAGDQGSVFYGPMDTVPLGTFDPAYLGTAAASAKVITLATVMGNPGEMNSAALAAAVKMHPIKPADLSAAPDGCPLRSPCPAGDDSVGCCLDYDGPGGDQLPRSRSTGPNDPVICDAKAYLNFILSTCFNWTATLDCSNESAYPGHAGGPNCWNNHKYRNCQNLDRNDFSETATTSTTIYAGGTVTLHLHNNTPANDTVASTPSIGSLTLTGPGSMETKGGSLIVHHYDDPSRKHFKDTDLLFTAPVTTPNGGQATVTLTFQAFGFTSTETITINPLPKPVIKSFTAYPISIPPTGSSLLSWDVSYALSLSIDQGIGALHSAAGSIDVYPNATTTYTLTATGPGGSAAAQVTVSVTAPPPVISSFTATPATIPPGQSSVLNWSVNNATSLSLNPGGAVTGTSLNVQPASTTTYTLTAMGPGGSTQAQTTVTVLQSSVISLTGGLMHSIFAYNGLLWACGDRQYGTVGDGVISDTPLLLWTPITVPAGTTQVSGGAYFSSGDGAAVTWGDNTFSELGNGQANTTPDPTPTPVNGLPSVSSISAGYIHTLALAPDTHVWVWGNVNFTYGIEAILGDGTTNGSSIPVQVPGLSGITAVAASKWSYFSLTLKNDGTVWSWGDDSLGQCGDGAVLPPLGTQRLVKSPVQVVGLTHVVAIDAGFSSAIALKDDGTVWIWGSSSIIQGVLGSKSTSSTPIQVPGLSNISAISSGCGFLLALKSDGTLWGAGDDSAGDGVLGNGLGTSSTVPVQVSGLANVTHFAAGYFHAFARTRDGKVWAWGRNKSGQLGDGSTTNRLSPIQIPGLSFP